MYIFIFTVDQMIMYLLTS